MRILFCNTNYQERVEYTSLISVIPPLDLAYCASFVRKNIPDAAVSILDANVLRLGYEGQLSRIMQVNPDIVVFTAATHSVNAVKRLCNSLSNKKSLKVLIGPHGTALPQRTLNEIDGLDIVVAGEPELTVSEIAQSLMDRTDISRVKGIWYRAEREVRNTGSRPLMADLDILPFPARDLLPNSKYFCPYSSGVTALQTTRGCPGQCVFCDSHLMNGQLYRARDPGRVVEEMEECVNRFGIKYFAIIDHTFTAKRLFVEEVCRGILSRGLIGRIRWACNTRVDMLDDELVRLMKKAGCIQVGIGIESGYDAGLELIKKDITEDQIKGAIGRLKKAGIIAMGYAIIGFPDDTMADLKKTRDKIFDFDPHALQLSFATPLPGSRLYETCVQKDLIATDSWDDYTFLRRSIIRNSSISRGELEELRRGIIKEFYFRPKKIFELSTFLAFTTKPDYLNCFKAFLKIISNIGK